jgi:hypothetical protein
MHMLGGLLKGKGMNEYDIWFLTRKVNVASYLFH